MSHPIEHSKHIVDVVAAGTTVGTLAGWLPAIAAVFTIVWTAIRIYETAMVQKLLHQKKKSK